MFYEDRNALLRHVARAVTVGSCSHEPVSAVRCLGIAHGETHGCNPIDTPLANLRFPESRK